jgi:tRNA (cmo5U34)-methyltransferase
LSPSDPERTAAGRAAATSIGHRPGPRWEFDQDVTRVFDDMLRRSIPEYEAMRRVVFEVGKRFVRPGTAVVDLGCSRGEALAPFVAEFGDRARYVGVDVSAPMLEACRGRFEAEIEAGLLSVHDLDLRRSYPSARASLTLAVLTLQFTPLEDRPQILRAACDHTVPGGALLLVEKVLPSSTRADRLMTEIYHDLKRSQGYGEEEITRKALSLEGVLVPASAEWNEEALREAGFAEVECLWRWLNFGAWLAVRGG